MLTPTDVKLVIRRPNHPSMDSFHIIHKATSKSSDDVSSSIRQGPLASSESSRFPRQTDTTTDNAAHVNPQMAPALGNSNAFRVIRKMASQSVNDLNNIQNLNTDSAFSHQGNHPRTHPTSFHSSGCITDTIDPPYSGTFQSARVSALIEFVLEAYLHKVRYESTRCSQLARDLCSVIKDRVKELNMTRYKLVVHVTVGQATQETVHLASRCIWNQTTDECAAGIYRNNSLYAVGIVYGMYLQ